MEKMRPLSTTKALAGLEAFDKVWRHKRVFAGVFLGTMIVAIVALLVLPVRYLATASVIVAEQEPGASNMSPVWAQRLGDPADLESQLLLIRSSRLLRPVMSAPGVLAAVKQECERASQFGGSSCDKLSDTTAFMAYVETHYGIASAGRSRVINISYQSAIPEVAQTMANALTTAFLEDQRAEGANSRGVATAWLWQELKQLNDQLQADEGKIQEFRRKKGLMRGTFAPITSERLTGIAQQLSAAESARADAAARLKEIKSEQARGPIDAPSVLASRTVADLKQQLTTVSAQLANAASALGPKHPSILALSREQALVQQRLVGEMQNIAASAQKTYDASNSLADSLKKQMETIKAEAGAATLDEASIESMVRDAGIKRQQYAELYKKASELETERRILQGSTRLVSLAELPNKPFFPKKIPFLAAGATLALILSFAAALLANRLVQSVPDQPALPALDRAVPASSTTVANVTQRPVSDEKVPVAEVAGTAVAVPLQPLPPEEASLLSRMAGVPVLAHLHKLKATAQQSAVGSILQSHIDLPVPKVLHLAAGDVGFQTELRELEHALRIGNSGSTRRIVVTSAGRGEGKTVTAVALAQYLAAEGCRVLVVQCDALNPDLASIFTLAGGPGLLGVLTRSIPVREAIEKTANPNLDTLVFGTGPANAADFLGDRIAALLAAVNTYQVVLLDVALPSRPAQYLAEADNVIVCMKGNRPLIESAASVVARVRALGAARVGIVVTMDETFPGGGMPSTTAPGEASLARVG